MLERWECLLEALQLGCINCWISKVVPVSASPHKIWVFVDVCPGKGYFYLFIIFSPGSFCLRVWQVFIRLYCHQTILDFVQHRQSTFYPPSLQRLPLQFFQHLIYTASPLIVLKSQNCTLFRILYSYPEVKRLSQILYHYWTIPLNVEWLSLL